MLTTVDIINTLQRPNLNIDAIGEVYIYHDSIIVGNNSVVSRCRIRGIESDFLLKILFSPDVTPNQCRHTICVTYINVFTLSGHIYRTCCILREWIDGITLDDAIYNGKCDYKSLSILFDRLAYEILTSEDAHGDIAPDNILICNNKMELIDNDAKWRPDDDKHNSNEYGSPGFAHPHRKIKQPAKDMDDYPIAVMSTMLAAISHYASESPEGVDPRRVIPQMLLDDIVAPMQRSIELAKQKLLDVGDMAHYNIACTIGGVLSHIPELQILIGEIVSQANSQEH